LHWTQANREKKAFWAELLKRSQIRRGFPAAPSRPLQRVEIRAEWFARHAGHAPDKDNIIRRLKPAIDWLVANDWLAGDTAEHVSWRDPVVCIGEPTPILCSVRLTISSIAN
jgi:hypothetical protein